MNRINKEDLVEYLKGKIKVNKVEIDNIRIIVDELYNINNNIVIPLTQEETYYFRKRYGILDNNIPQPIESISEECNISYMKLLKTLENVLLKFRFRIKQLDNYIKINKLSSIDLDSRVEDFQNITIMSLPINTKPKNKLMISNIITIKDLMELGIPEIKEMISDKSFDDLSKCIHLLNISFIDELSIEERKEIITNFPIDLLLDSSIYWIDGTNAVSQSLYKKNNIKDIKTLILNMNFLPKSKQIIILNGLKKMNLGGLINKKY